ncbi:MAG: hypothetical protein JO202_05525 [Ktedonobacteraceae bacterium]|nr:hypothetical protein [Ktedonobacteraceae bacterium]
MAEALSSVRIRTSLHNALRLAAAQLTEACDMQVTMRGLLEEEIEGMLARSLEAWACWAEAGQALERAHETTSEPFRIRSDLSRRLTTLAASISQRSQVPVTKIQLLEEAGWKIVKKARQEVDELRAVGVHISGEG